MFRAIKSVLSGTRIEETREEIREENREIRDAFVEAETSRIAGLREQMHMIEHPELRAVLEKEIEFRRGRLSGVEELLKGIGL